MADNNEDKKVTEETNEPKEPKEPKEEKTSGSSGSSGTSPTSTSVSPTLAKLIGEIEKLSVIELSDLVRALEEKFGVSAAPAVIAQSAQAPTAGGEEGVSQQTTFNVILADSGTNKISVIKAVRELVPTLGLKDAKDVVDAPPKPILEGVNKETAQEAKTKLEAAGAKVELK